MSLTSSTWASDARLIPSYAVHTHFISLLLQTGSSQARCFLWTFVSYRNVLIPVSLVLVLWSVFHCLAFQHLQLENLVFRFGSSALTAVHRDIEFTRVIYSDTTYEVMTQKLTSHIQMIPFSDALQILSMSLWPKCDETFLRRLKSKKSEPRVQCGTLRISQFI